MHSCPKLPADAWKMDQNFCEWELLEEPTPPLFCQKGGKITKKILAFFIFIPFLNKLVNPLNVSFPILDCALAGMAKSILSLVFHNFDAAFFTAHN